MIEIGVPNSSYCETTLPLNGVVYTLEFKYNSTTQAWYIDIYRGDIPVVLSAKLIPDVNILKRADKTLITGNMMAVMKNKTEEPITRNNIGEGKPYRLIYF